MDEFFEKDPGVNRKGIIVLAIFISAIVGICVSYSRTGDIDWLGVFLSVLMFAPIWIIIIQSLTRK